VPPDLPLKVLASAGQRSDIFAALEPRAEQREMMIGVTKAMNQGDRLLVEAGTGTGKSLAYLIPAACHAGATGSRTVVSTATINLQDQLTSQDVPAVQSLLSADNEDFRACHLKGRRNYLCLRRFAALRSASDLSDDEARIASRILIWLTQTETGDRAELRLSPAEEAIWRRLSADGADCTSGNSPYVVEGTCFLQRSRRKAEASHVVVVNHALLLSDATVGGHIIPPYDHLVVDEAHHLEDEATRQFGFRSGDRELAGYLDRCEALVGGVRNARRGSRAALSPMGELEATADAARRASTKARGHLRELVQLLLAFLAAHAGNGAERDSQLLINHGMRVQPDWSNIEIAWENLRLGLEDVLAPLSKLDTAIGEAAAAESSQHFELLEAEIGSLSQEGKLQSQGLAAALEEDDPQKIVWLEQFQTDGSLTVAWAPLSVNELLRERLYAEPTSVVLTGATLTSEGSFDFTAQRLGLEEAQTLAVGSSFDYESSALVLLPRDMPEPARPEYLESLNHAIVDLVRASEGRALVLFTSHATLRAAHSMAREPLQNEGILALGQGVDGSPRYLARSLKANRKTVIFGTASLWEGVDIPGEALSLLIMTRLPFSVPTEPVFAARSASYDDPFLEYALPKATLRFKQGFGRLIRSKTDQGVMVVLDRRIASKPYGSAFLKSLPACPVREVALREMPDMIRARLAPVQRDE
jgi:DNA polymerase-3 subunit epsilon/ATP-dependent DNA helicase DinG